jgi:hypothetical protein
MEKADGIRGKRVEALKGNYQKPVLDGINVDNRVEAKCSDMASSTGSIGYNFDCDYGSCGTGDITSCYWTGPCGVGDAPQGM